MKTMLPHAESTYPSISGTYSEITLPYLQISGTYSEITLPYLQKVVITTTIRVSTTITKSLYLNAFQNVGGRMVVKYTKLNIIHLNKNEISLKE